LLNRRQGGCSDRGAWSVWRVGGVEPTAAPGHFHVPPTMPRRWPPAQSFDRATSAIPGCG